MANHFTAQRGELTLLAWEAQTVPAFRSTMRKILNLLALAVCTLVVVPGAFAVGNLSVSPGTQAILDHIYSGRSDLAIPEAQAMQREQPSYPLGFLLEAEARWWEIWCVAAEYKYGMSMPRHKDKQPSDQIYLELTTKAETLALASLAQHETAEMHFYAGMAEAQASRMYSLRGENRAAAHQGVRGREHLVRALALDSSLYDADLGLGLYNYYVDTLSTIARVLRFFMGIPGGTKEEGILQLRQAMKHGKLIPAAARFYLAINLHNYDQKYEEALRVITPLVEKYPENPIFLLARGDLYGKLGRKPQAIADYQAAEKGQFSSPGCRQKIEQLASAALLAQGAK